MSQPNVVLINCDDLGYGDLGCYGSTRNKTPGLDAMADEGARFDSFYMASPLCSPSRAALLTGCYPTRIGFGSFEGLPVLFPGQPVGLPPSEISIASLLRRAGYRTQMIGKWHCGDQPDFLPTNHGFDHYFGVPYSNDMGRQVGTKQSTPLGADYPPLPLLDDLDVIEQQPDQSALTERYVTEAVRFIRANRSRPFFLYLAHLYVHLPIYVQSRFAQQSANGAYGAAVECIDWATSVILRELQAQELDDRTLVIFTSDNGSRADDAGGSNAPLRGAKRTTWEGGLRVPCIARWPGRIEPSRAVDALATAMDLYPTLVAICGGELPADRVIDGRDISGLLFDPAASSPHDAFFYYWMNDLEAVRSHRYKLHFSKWGQPVHELYDLVDDPSEATNVIDEHPEVVTELEARADAARRALGDARLGVEGNEVRSIGRVPDARPLTSFDVTHPYYMAEYDLSYRG